MKRLALCIALVLFLLSAFPLMNATAAGSTIEEQLTVMLKYNGTPLRGIDLCLHRVAGFSRDAAGKVTYVLTGVFTSSGADLDGIDDAGKNRAQAALLAGTVASTGAVPTTGGKSRDDGIVEFSELEAGLYLLLQENVTADGYKVSSVLIPIPFDDANGVRNNVVLAEPKIEPPPPPTTPPTPPTTPITDTPPPTGSTPPPSASPTTSPPPPTPTVSIPDVSVPTTGLESDTDELTELPTPPPPRVDLPQTGVLRWPVPVLFILGGLVIVAGIYILARKEKRTNAPF